MTQNDSPDTAPGQADQPTQPEQPDPTGGTGSARREDAPPPGSVAEEAALLVDLLSRRSWSSLSGMPPRRSGGEPADAAAHDDGAAGGTGIPEDSTGADATGRPDGRAGECTCGGTTPAACRVCPVCQLIAFVQQVNPDTIEKVADFVGFAATALRDLAAAQRERGTTPATGNDPEETSTGGTA